MLSYDDPDSIAVKADFVRTHGLAGLMTWELSDDDDESSLLKAMIPRTGT
jgi:chitinase